LGNLTMTTTARQKQILLNASTMFDRGCLLASESLLAQMRDSNRELSAKASGLLDEIRKLRDAARNTTIELSDDAAEWEVSKLCASSLQKNGGMDMDLVGVLLEDGDEQRKALKSHLHTALYVETANAREHIKQNMTRPLLLNNDRATGWAAIRDGLRKHPFVTLWCGEIELNDITVVKPKLVHIARITFNPTSEGEDRKRAEGMLRYLNDTQDDADLPTIRWWAAFLLIDAKFWTHAQQVIREVLSDCTARGIWPAYYLPEALYLAAMVEFGLDDQDECGQYLESYFDLADPLDRNRADATLLNIWAQNQRPPRPPTLQALCSQQLAKEVKAKDKSLEEHDQVDHFNPTERVLYDELPKLRDTLSDIWDDHTFAYYTWLRMEVSSRLGIDEENPFIPLIERIEQSWKGLMDSGRRRPVHVDETIQRLKNSCGRTITVRHIETEKQRDDW